ncbi:MAG: hypothetical protein KA066_02355 [Candidatus Pacebacteria bacterium]|nr:hypothetical protein [Candidatus Paceibacterota bacterium]
MNEVIRDLLGRDLAGHKLIEAKLLALDHSLMGYFPAIFSNSKGQIVFLDDAVLSDAKTRLEERRSKVQKVLFLLEPDGESGYVLHGNDPMFWGRFEVYTRQDFDSGTPIEWAPGLL